MLRGKPLVELLSGARRASLSPPPPFLLDSQVNRTAFMANLRSEVVQAATAGPCQAGSDVEAKDAVGSVSENYFVYLVAGSRVVSLWLLSYV